MYWAKTQAASPSLDSSRYTEYPVRERRSSKRLTFDSSMPASHARARTPGAKHEVWCGSGKEVSSGKELDGASVGGGSGGKLLDADAQAGKATEPDAGPTNAMGEAGALAVHCWKTTPWQDDELE